jgi:hypothetical protein
MHKLVIRTLLLLAFSALIASVPAHAQVAVGISVGFAPPAVPVYTQPVCPGDGYIWTPGYWAWDPEFDDYYWVPGTWVEPPEVGFLWTPGYWAWGGSAFVFHDGYWGPQVGFYGGINYGFGYFGNGYAGGRWDHDHFYYNRAVNNVNVTVVHNVYNERITNVRNSRVSYNGGRGGITARPTAQQEDFARQRHTERVAAQTRQIQAARDNRNLRASVNHGKPPIAATARPGEFTGKVVKAKAAGAPYKRPSTRSTANSRGNANTPPENKSPGNAHEASRQQNRPSNVNRAEGNAQANKERAPAANTHNARINQNHQQQRKPAERQQEQRQKPQQQQAKEGQQHQQQRQRAQEQRTRAVEQNHAKQTRQPQQKQERPPQQRQERPPQQRQVRQQRQRQEPQRQERRQSPRPAAHPGHAEHSAPAERKGGGR